MEGGGGGNGSPPDVTVDDVGGGEGGGGRETRLYTTTIYYSVTSPRRRLPPKQIFLLHQLVLLLTRRREGEGAMECYNTPVTKRRRRGCPKKKNLIWITSYTNIQQTSIRLNEWMINIPYSILTWTLCYTSHKISYRSFILQLYTIRIIDSTLYWFMQIFFFKNPFLVIAKSIIWTAFGDGHLLNKMAAERLNYLFTTSIWKYNFELKHTHTDWHDPQTSMYQNT